MAGAGQHPDRLTGPVPAFVYRDPAEIERRFLMAAGPDLRAGFAGLESPVVVACSGGPDSLALLALAAE
ncbi:MAG: hypothetical protein QOD57_1799, partial [Actinomycetota bacterium]|nr:hypothetical protein [Actinomycetota bacterium]